MQHGLEGILHVGKKFERYETKGDKVVAYFDDGSSVEGDLLLGICLHFFIKKIWMFNSFIVWKVLMEQARESELSYYLMLREWEWE